MKNILDYNKEQYRGTLKQIMKVRGLRTISIANYYNWRTNNGKTMEQPSVHSLKLDIQDGYINAYGWDGKKIEDATASEYRSAYDIVNDMLANEHNIPYRIRRNIFVKVSR
jgi:hypothetical protein